MDPIIYICYDSCTISRLNNVDIARCSLTTGIVISQLIHSPASQPWLDCISVPMGSPPWPLRHGGEAGLRSAGRRSFRRAGWPLGLGGLFANAEAPEGAFGRLCKASGEGASARIPARRRRFRSGQLQDPRAGARRPPLPLFRERLGPASAATPPACGGSSCS